MQDSGVTQPVKFLVNETPLLVFGSRSPGRKGIDNNIALTF